MTRRSLTAHALVFASAAIGLTVLAEMTASAHLFLAVVLLVIAPLLFRRLIDESKDRQSYKRTKDIQALVDASPALIWLKDKDNVILRVNAAAARSLGMTVSELEGKSTYDVYPAEAAKYHADDLEVIRSGQPKLDMVETYSLPSGETRWVRTDKIPMRDDSGKTIGVIVHALDVTAQKIVEEQLREALERADVANRTKDQLLATVSHEMRTPLAAILGFAEVGLDPNLSHDKRQQCLAKVVANAQHLSEIVDGLFDFARFERGVIQLDLRPVDLARFFREVEASIEPRARAKGLSLQFQTEACHGIVKTDPTRLRQILYNLLDNALKFTVSGGITVLAQIEESAAHSDHARLRILVKDSGTGISLPAEELFQPLAASGRSTSNETGLGLGLPLSRMLARALGGNVELLESSTSGTTFAVSVEVGTKKERDEGDKANPLPSIVAPQTGPRLSGQRILVVDDSPDLLALYELFLANEAASVTTAADGDTALAKASKEEFSHVLMDIRMPRLSGIEVTRQLRERGFGGRIIAVTACNTSDDPDRLRASGFDAVLPKPFTKKNLIEALRSLSLDGGPDQAPSL